MIINETYDRSLWLMLCGDKVNREKITSFLKLVPREFYTMLRISLGFYVSREMNFSINKDDEFYKSFFNGEVITSGDMRYWYVIEPRTGVLSLGENIIDEDEEYELFHMILYPIDKKVLLDETRYHDCLVGKIVNNEYLDKVNNMISYNMIRFPFCDLLVSSCKCGLRFKNKYHLIDMDKMPEKYNINNIKSEESVKKLIRGRKF